jgi:hypothetical protein
MKMRKQTTFLAEAKKEMIALSCKKKKLVNGWKGSMDERRRGAD